MRGRQEHRRVPRRDRLPALFQWLGRSLLAAGSSVSSMYADGKVCGGMAGVWMEEV